MIYFHNIVVSLRTVRDVPDDINPNKISSAFVADVSMCPNAVLNLTLEHLNVLAVAEWLRYVCDLGLADGCTLKHPDHTPTHILEMFQYKRVNPTVPRQVDEVDTLVAFLNLVRPCSHGAKGKDYLDELRASQDESHERGKVIEEFNAALRKTREERDYLKAENDKLRGELYALSQQTTATSLRVKHDGCPEHYDLGEVGEVLDVCRELARTLPESFSGAYIGGMYLEAVKYVLRAPRKSGIADLLKAAHYINIIAKELRQ